MKWHEFRESTIWQSSVNGVLKEFVFSVRRVYNQYSKIVNMRSIFNIDSAVRLLQDARAMKIVDGNKRNTF